MEKSMDGYIKELVIKYRKKKIPLKAARLGLGLQFSNTGHIAAFFKELRNEPIEKSYVVYVNSENVIQAVQLIATGGINYANIPTFLVFSGALLSGATGVVLIHNHPSGNPKPSLDDQKITRQLKSGAELLNIKFIDHLIIGENKYYSFTYDAYRKY